MPVQLKWDDDQQQVVRWEFTRAIEVLDYIIPVNETAAMAMMGNGKADIIVNMGWRLCFPSHSMHTVKQALLAARWYALGTVIIVSRNPLALAIIAVTLRRDPELSGVLFVVPALEDARQHIARSHAAAESQHSNATQ
jgi:hypothetical protein